MSVKWILAGATAILIGVVAGTLSLWREQSEAQPVSESAGPPAPVEEIMIPGVLSSANVISVPPPVEGTLEMVIVDVGTEVYQGMLLAQIYNTAVEDELQLAKEDLEEAEGDVDRLSGRLASSRLEASRADADLIRVRDEYQQAQKTAERQRMLYRKGATPKLVYQKAQSDFAEARKKFQTAEAAERQASDRVMRQELQLESAQAAVAKINDEIEELNQEMEAAQVTSPVNGIITGMGARQGEEVQPGMGALFQIAVNLTQMEVILEPSPTEMRWLFPGQSVMIYVDQAPGQQIEGEVTEMTVGRAVVEFANPWPHIRPGMRAQVKVSRTETAPARPTHTETADHLRRNHGGPRRTLPNAQPRAERSRPPRSRPRQAG